MMHFSRLEKVGWGLWPRYTGKDKRLACLSGWIRERCEERGGRSAYNHHMVR